MTGLEPAYRALAQGRYETAFALLESAASRQRGSGAAQFQLQLAAIYALYGYDGLENGLRCLKEATEADAAVAERPLYRALYWEFSAYQGDSERDVRRGALTVTRQGDAVASYHAASALLVVRAHKRALPVLSNLKEAELPNYLSWRRWSLLGQAYEQGGDFPKAIDAYAQAVAQSPFEDQQRERLNLAANWLELGDAFQALEVLQQVDEGYLPAISDQAVKCYLEGRVHLLLGNPNQALGCFLQADVLEGASGETSFALKLVLAQTYATLAQLGHAVSYYREAILLASKHQRTFALHEYAYLLFEHDQLLESKEVLFEAVNDKHYAHRAEIYADLAEIALRLGDSAEADDLARRALDLGAVAPACLCLGNLALEEFRFDDAIAWFEQAASDSREGEPDWLMAQEMLADTLAQQDYRAPERLFQHATLALRYLEPNDEWAITLRRYIAEAQARLGGKARLLN